jgi:hypothetical protein
VIPVINFFLPEHDFSCLGEGQSGVFADAGTFLSGLGNDIAASGGKGLKTKVISLQPLAKIFILVNALYYVLQRLRKTYVLQQRLSAFQELEHQAGDRQTSEMIVVRRTHILKVFLIIASEPGRGS